jgi:hypothetical protein
MIVAASHLRMLCHADETELVAWPPALAAAARASLYPGCCCCGSDESDVKPPALALEVILLDVSEAGGGVTSGTRRSSSEWLCMGTRLPGTSVGDGILVRETSRLLCLCGEMGGGFFLSHFPTGRMK